MMWQLIKKVALIIFACFFFLILLGVTYQFVSTKIDERRYPASGNLVDIGGYRLHLYRSGEGKPTVVFDAGMGCYSLEWSLIQKKVAAFTSSCSYDRAGYGWSDESPLERTSLNMVEELHLLLKKSQVTGPYILVGHSFGGVNTLLYAQKYPQEVAGVILVDSCHEDQLDKMPFVGDCEESLTLFLTYTGIVRFVYNYLTEQNSFEMFSDVIKKSYEATEVTNSTIRTMFKETSGFDESLKQLKASGSHLGNIPLVVITAGKTDEDNDERRFIWESLQKDLVTKSTKSKQIFAEQSGHMIKREEPEIIVEAIKEMLVDLSF